MLHVPPTYFKINWKTGDTEIIAGTTFESAFSESGYGKKSRELITSYQVVEANLDEARSFMEKSFEVANQSPVDWNKISPEGRDEWCRKATDFYYGRKARFGQRPDKFPRIK